MIQKRREFLKTSLMYGWWVTIFPDFFRRIFHSPDADISNALGLGDPESMSPQIESYFRAKKNASSVSFEDETNYFRNWLPNDMVTRSIIFRKYVDENMYYFVDDLSKAFGSGKGSLNMDEWFILRTTVEKLLQKWFEDSIRSSSNDSVLVPNRDFISWLLRTWISKKDIEVYVAKEGVDFDGLRSDLEEKNAYPNEIKDTDFMLGWSKFVPYNISIKELGGLWMIELDSSLQHYNTEDWSSMHKLRTGMTVKRSTLNNAKVFFKGFKDFAASFGGARIIIRWWRERWHAYDTYFEKPSGKPIWTKINAAKDKQGNPLRAKILNDSHIFWNCFDLRGVGKDWLLLYKYISDYSYTIEWKKSWIVKNSRMKFDNGEISFEFLYHGWDPLGGHFHCYFG